MSRIRLTDDWVFRYVFGSGTEESNKALISLLNAVLDRADNPITEVVIKNPATLDEFMYSHEVVMDIRAIAGNEQFDIEMQVDHLANYRNRAIFNAGKLVNTSLEKGKDYGKMKKSIVISFIDKIIFHEFDYFHSVFWYKEGSSNMVLSDIVELHFIELGKLDFTKSPEDMTLLEIFSAFLKIAGNPEMDEYVRRLSESNQEVIRMTADVYSKVTADERAQAIADSRDIYEHDLATRFAEAEERGRMDGEIKTILKFVSSGYITVETAAEELGMSVDEIKGLMNE